MRLLTDSEYGTLKALRDVCMPSTYLEIDSSNYAWRRERLLKADTVSVALKEIIVENRCQKTGACAVCIANERPMCVEVTRILDIESGDTKHNSAA